MLFGHGDLHNIKIVKIIFEAMNMQNAPTQLKIIEAPRTAVSMPMDPNLLHPHPHRLFALESG